MLSHSDRPQSTTKDKQKLHLSSRNRSQVSRNRLPDEGMRLIPRARSTLATINRHFSLIAVHKHQTHTFLSDCTIVEYQRTHLRSGSTESVITGRIISVSQIVCDRREFRGSKHSSEWKRVPITSWWLFSFPASGQTEKRGYTTLRWWLVTHHECVIRDVLQCECK